MKEFLKKEYNLNDNDSLLILKSDNYIKNFLITIIQYEVFNPLNFSKINMNLCDDIKININIPVSINEDNLYKYDPNSDYYNDICFPSKSKNGTDIIIKDRQDEFIKNNLSLCERDCQYIGYDKTTKKSNCQCKVKKEMTIFNIKINTGYLYDNFLGDSSSNIGIIKFYYLLFLKDSLKKILEVIFF